MSIQLIRQAFNGDRSPPKMWRTHELKECYDVVIIGGGAHGLACAYYLAKEHGITDVAVLEKNYIGAGGSGRNTAIIRSNYLTSEGVRFYNESVKLYEQLSDELNFNVMFSQRGHLTLAHTDGGVNTMRRRAEVNQIEGVDSRLIFPDEIKSLCPYLDVSDHPRYPILAALYHPPRRYHSPRCGCLGLCPSSGRVRHPYSPKYRGNRNRGTGRKSDRRGNNSWSY